MLLTTFGVKTSRNHGNLFFVPLWPLWGPFTTFASSEKNPATSGCFSLSHILREKTAKYFFHRRERGEFCRWENNQSFSSLSEFYLMEKSFFPREKGGKIWQGKSPNEPRLAFCWLKPKNVIPISCTVHTYTHTLGEFFYPRHCQTPATDQPGLACLRDGSFKESLSLSLAYTLAHFFAARTNRFFSQPPPEIHPSIRLHLVGNINLPDNWWR